MNKGISKTAVIYLSAPCLSLKAIMWTRTVGQTSKDPRVGRQHFHTGAVQAKAVAGHVAWMKALQGLGPLEKYPCTHKSRAGVSSSCVFHGEGKRGPNLGGVESLARMFNS